MTEQVKSYAALIAEAERRKFAFEVEPGGRQWTIKHVRDMDYRIARDGVIGGNLQAIADVFRKGMGEQQYADWEQIEQPTELVSAIFNDYLDHCGLSQGKSPSSTDSSPSTPKPSKRASKRTTRSASPTSSPAGSASVNSSAT